MTVRLALATLLLVVPSLGAQAIVDNGIDDRVEALNAIFAFRNYLVAGGTVIARCPIPTVVPL